MSDDEEEFETEPSKLEKLNAVRLKIFGEAGSTERYDADQRLLAISGIGGILVAILGWAYFGSGLTEDDSVRRDCVPDDCAGLNYTWVGTASANCYGLNSENEGQFEFIGDPQLCNPGTAYPAWFRPYARLAQGVKTRCAHADKTGNDYEGQYFKCAERVSQNWLSVMAASVIGVVLLLLGVWQARTAITQYASIEKQEASEATNANGQFLNVPLYRGFVTMGIFLGELAMVLLVWNVLGENKESFLGEYGKAIATSFIATCMFICFISYMITWTLPGACCGPKAGGSAYSAGEGGYTQDESRRLIVRKQFKLRL